MRELKRWILPIVVCALGVASVVEWNNVGNSWVDTWFHEIGHVFGAILGFGFGTFSIGDNYSGKASAVSILPWWNCAGAYSIHLIIAYFLIRKYKIRGLIALPFMVIMAQKSLYHNFVNSYNTGDLQGVPGGVAGIIVIGVIQLIEFGAIMEYILYRKRVKVAKAQAELAAKAKRKALAREAIAHSSVRSIPSRPVPQVGRTVPRTLASTR